ncbi:MAG: hypothetical protein NDI61_06835 [Bdellovibrionaceae bacterium]|nr:hypothetical protein [Pseudobdellovibrionaceae bacterium]
MKRSRTPHILIAIVLWTSSLIWPALSMANWESMAALAGPSPTPVTTSEYTGATPVKTRVPLAYRLLKRFAIDIDHIFTDSLGLEPAGCDFQNALNSTLYRQPGLGACLYRSWQTGLKTHQLPGVIDAVVKPVRAPEQEIRMEIRWRAAEGNLLKTASRLLKMRKDSGLPEDMRKTTIVGNLQVRFHEPVNPLLFLDPNISRLFLVQPKGVERLDITTHHDPETGRETLAHLLFYFAGDTQPSYEVHVRTDRNFFKQRAFFLEAEGQ